MIRPHTFRYNEQTALSNHFQEKESQLNDADIASLAQGEFDNFTKMLRSEGVNLYLFQDDALPDTPDAVFPNNWMSFHGDARIAMYPMQAQNRRGERREEIFDILADDFGFKVEEVEDFTHFEEEGLFLEGTGSMVLDRMHRIAYAALSPRTDMLVLETFCDQFNFDHVVFHASQTINDQRVPIYHTNVMMSLGNSFAIVCLNCVDDNRERETLKASIKSSGRKIIEITEAQVAQFAGNALEVMSKTGERLCVMSTSAFNALRPDQKDAISKHARIVHSPLDIIETHGGGSARCMMTEIFLPKTSTE
jgi:hypothetical protein